MKLLLVDLDDTLIAIRHYKKAVFAKLHELCHLPESEIIEIYDSVKKSEKWPYKLVVELSRRTRIAETVLEEVLMEHFHLFSVNKNVLEYVKNFPGTVALLSYGDLEFQMKKVKHFGLEGLFSYFFISFDNKDDVLNGFLKGSTLVIDEKVYNEVTLIDNNWGVISSVRKRFPWIHVIDTADIV